MGDLVPRPRGGLRCHVTELLVYAVPEPATEPDTLRAQAATSCNSARYTASTMTMIRRLHPVRLPPNTRKSPATTTPTMRRPLRCSRIHPPERRTRSEPAAA